MFKWKIDWNMKNIFAPSNFVFGLQMNRALDITKYVWILESLELAKFDDIGGWLTKI